MLDFLLLHGVLTVPYVVSDELLDRLFPSWLKFRILVTLNLMDQPIHVLNQDVVTCDQDTLLVFNAHAVHHSLLLLLLHGDINFFVGFFLDRLGPLWERVR